MLLLLMYKYHTQVLSKNFRLRRGTGNRDIDGGGKDEKTAGGTQRSRPIAAREQVSRRVSFMGQGFVRSPIKPRHEAAEGDEPRAGVGVDTGVRTGASLSPHRQGIAATTTTTTTPMREVAPLSLYPSPPPATAAASSALYLSPGGAGGGGGGAGSAGSAGSAGGSAQVQRTVVEVDWENQHNPLADAFPQQRISASRRM